MSTRLLQQFLVTAWIDSYQQGSVTASGDEHSFVEHECGAAKHRYLPDSATKRQGSPDTHKSVSESRRALAPFIHSPKWLYPAQGVGMGLFIVGLVLVTSYGWATVALGASVIVFCLLPILQSRRARVILDVYTHPGSRLIGLAYLAAFTALVAAALVLHAMTGADWMVYLAALLAFVLTVIAGPSMETKLARWIGTSH